MKPTLITDAWLCEENNSVWREGEIGKLAFDGGSISFTPKVAGKTIVIRVEDLKLADLNNIMAQSQMILNMQSGKQFVFSLSKPVSAKTAFGKALFLPKPFLNYDAFSGLARGSSASSKWKNVLTKGLPAEKLQTRKEIRIGFVLIVTLATIVIIGVLFWGFLMLATE
jgi:hypothetical protein